MGTLASELRDLAAAAALDAYELLFGAGNLAYSHRGAAGVTLTGSPGQEDRDLAEILGLEAEATARTFHVPRQTGFPPSGGVALNDQITWDSQVFFVRRIRADQLAPVYLLDCVREKAHRLGTA